MPGSLIDLPASWDRLQGGSPCSAGRSGCGGPGRNRGKPARMACPPAVVRARYSMIGSGYIADDCRLGRALPCSGEVGRRTGRALVHRSRPVVGNAKRNHTRDGDTVAESTTRDRHRRSPLGRPAAGTLRQGPRRGCLRRTRDAPWALHFGCLSPRDGPPPGCGRRVPSLFPRTGAKGGVDPPAGVRGRLVADGRGAPGAGPGRVACGDRNERRRAP